MKVVLDTNVLLSAVITPLGVTGAILEAWRGGRFTLVTSPPLLAELRRALAYPHLVKRTGWGEHAQADFVQLVADRALVVMPAREVALQRDPSDARILEAAEAGAADYIVTGDQDILSLGSHHDIPVIQPAHFLSILTVER